MLEQEVTCCFTGNCVEKLPREPEQMEIILFRLGKAIDAAVRGGCHLFLQGGCPGVDLIAAELVLEKKEECPHLQLVTVVPFVGQAARWDSQWVRRYEAVLKSSDAVITLRQELHGSAMARAYHARNRFMVDNSKMVIAVHDGGKGGTLHTIEYAKSLNRQMYIIPTERNKLPQADHFLGN